MRLRQANSLLTRRLLEVRMRDEARDLRALPQRARAFRVTQLFRHVTPQTDDSNRVKPQNGDGEQETGELALWPWLSVDPRADADVLVVDSAWSVRQFFMRQCEVSATALSLHIRHVPSAPPPAVRPALPSPARHHPVRTCSSSSRARRHGRLPPSIPPVRPGVPPCPRLAAYLCSPGSPMLSCCCSTQTHNLNCEAAASCAAARAAMALHRFSLVIIARQTFYDGGDDGPTAARDAASVGSTLLMVSGDDGVFAALGQLGALKRQR